MYMRMCVCVCVCGGVTGGCVGVASVYSDVRSSRVNTDTS